MESRPLQLEVAEYDEAGKVTATYVESGPRIDVILPEERKSLLHQVLDVFLPAGYPQSVTEDYLPYQIYDSLQAFSSSIAGLLSSRAVLEGVGVGDATASPTAALLLSVLQESTGRLATILFAAKLGTSLEPECKAWRLAADFFNDAAMLLDCISPALPKLARVTVLSFSSILRALCGVAAGSSKASLSAHFARMQNLGELNAKDSSQETIISLMGMLLSNRVDQHLACCCVPGLACDSYSAVALDPCWSADGVVETGFREARALTLSDIHKAGSVVVSWVSSPLATWASMLLLLTIHLGTNYAAVRAVSMRSLNRQRANIVMSHLLAYDKVLSPQQVSQKERIFELRDGALRWADDQVVGRCRIGVRVADIVTRLPGAEAGAGRKTGAVVRDGGAAAKQMSLSTLLKVFEHDSYLLWFDSARSEALIVLKQSCEPAAQLQAWTQALLLASRHRAGIGGRRGTAAAATTQTSRSQPAASQQGLRQTGRAAQQHGGGGGVSAGDSSSRDDGDIESELRLTLEQTRQMFGAGSGAAKARLEAAGWDLSIAALETHSGTRAGVRASLWSEKQ